MILRYSLLGNLLLLWMNIVNSVVMVGLYYGFLTIFSIEGSKKEVSTTTTFFMGQFIVFISTYYLPLHLALSRCHTLTILIYSQKNSFLTLSFNMSLYLMSKWRNSISQIFSIILFIICIFYLGRMSSPLITKKLKESTKGEENKKTEEEGNEVDGSVEEDLSISLEEEERWNLYKNIYEAEEIWLNGKEKVEFDLKEKENNELLWIEKSLLNEMSQYFFCTCASDGKQRISFTYPPTEKLPAEALSNEWVSTTKKQRNNLRNEFINRIEAIDKESLIFNVVEKRVRLCNDKEEQEFLPKFYDNLLNGPYRGTIKKEFERELEHKIDKIDVKSSSTGIEDSSVSIGEFTEEAEEAEKSRTRFKQFAFGEEEKVFDMVRADPNDKKISNLKIEEIKKKVSRWLYKLTSDLDFEEEEEEEEEHDQEESTDDHGIPEEHEITLIRYLQQSDFYRDLIKGSMWAQRRKTLTWEMFRTDVHSPCFFDRIDKTPLFSFDISRMMNLIRKNTKKKKGSIKEKRIKDRRRNE
ncbi:unnamed protein product [Victoria cruziana]